MDRLSALFEQLPLPTIARLLRRSVFFAIGVGVIALGISAILNHPLAGLGICIGLSIGLFNIRLVVRSVAHVNENPVANPKRVLASGTLVRLGMTTLVVVGLLFASLQLGFGTAAGIALFYFLLLINLVRSLLSHHGTSGVTA